jgi:hypothetical protein
MNIKEEKRRERKEERKEETKTYMSENNLDKSVNVEVSSFYCLTFKTKLLVWPVNPG